MKDDGDTLIILSATNAGLSSIVYVSLGAQCRSSSSMYWTGPFPGVPIEACALGGGGGLYALLKQLI